MAYRIVFAAPSSVLLQEFELDAPSTIQVKIRTELSLLSPGTEQTILNKSFAVGTHWDLMTRYPFYPGYSSVGLVEEIGPDVTSLNVGDVVAFRASHASHTVLPADQCFRIPKTLDLEKAVWFALAKIAFIGALRAGHTFGDTVLIVGCGPVGQMSVRWAHASGVQKCIVVCRSEVRSKAAGRGGATHLVLKPFRDAVGDIRRMVRHDPIRIGIDATGNTDILALLLGLIANHGRIVVIGDTGFPEKQHLSADFLISGITVVGAHDAHNDRRWDDRSITESFFQLASSGRFNLEGLTSHTFSPSDCKEVYNLISEHRSETLGVLFDWSALG